MATIETRAVCALLALSRFAPTGRVLSRMNIGARSFVRFAAG